MPDTQLPEPPLYGDTTQLVDLMNKIFGTQTSGTETTSPGNDAQALIQQFLARALPGIDSGQYSKEAAIKDSSGLVDQIMKQFTEGGLPQIYQAQQNSGGYNSTTAQLMSNDAVSRAAAAGAAATSKTITDYSQIQQQQKESLLKLVLGMLTASRTTTKAQTNNASSPPAKAAAALGEAIKNAMKGGQSTGKQTAPTTKDATPRDEARDVNQDAAGSGDPEAGIGGDDGTGGTLYGLGTGDESNNQLMRDLGGTPDTMEGVDTSFLDMTDIMGNLPTGTSGYDYILADNPPAFTFPDETPPETPVDTTTDTPTDESDAGVSEFTDEGDN
jgi:hypothetical protein